MKKFFVLLVLAISFASFSSFGLVRIKPKSVHPENTRIANTVNQISGMNNLANPDLIYPRQLLLLPVPGQSHPVYYDVVYGDNLWFISNRINRGDFAPIQQVQMDPDVEKPSIPGGMSFWYKYGDFIVSNFLWLLLLIFILAVIYKIVKAEKNKPKNIDPTTAGPAQVPGGVNDQNAHSRIHELAAARFPSATLVIKNIRRGHISGAGEIFYAGSVKPKRINLQNVPTYAGEILVNSKEQTIYFLQGCGNDARQGNFMSGEKFVFTPDVIINPDGSERSLDSTAPEAEAKPVENANATKEEAQKSSEAGSELYKISMAHTKLITEMLEKNLVHSGTTETFLENGCSVKTTFNIKNEAVGKVAKQTDKEKKG